jgi:superfamily II DNA/RNA helicase
MPPPIRKLADNYLYEPELVKVASAKLTVDTVEQFEVEVKQADKAERLVEVLRSRASRPGHRLRPHEGPLRPAQPQAAGPGAERQGAATAT